MHFFSLIKSAVSKFFTKNRPVISHEMQTQSELWHDVYMNQGFWLKNKDVTSLRLPTAITSELSRLVFSESEITANSSQYQPIIDDFRNRLDDEFETALAFGGMMFKPYLSHEKIFIDLIRQADEQWARIEWEYESKETALDVSMDMLKNNSLPKRKKRIYRQYDVDNLDGIFYHIFSPDIRDTAQFNYFNRILQRIEFNCGLAYGTLSDPQTVEKTAEEIKTSKQRSYTQVSAIQKNLESAIQNLFYAVSVYAKIGGITSDDAEIICTWGDSVLEDTDKEFQRRLQLVTSGNLKPEKLLAWYFSCSEEQALSYLPDKSNDGGLFSGDA